MSGSDNGGNTSSLRAVMDGTVCLVEEHRVGESKTFLFGVFADEGLARQEYGPPIEGWQVEFTTVPLFVRAKPDPGRNGS